MFTDSQTVANGLSKWKDNWKIHDWKISEKAICRSIWIDLSKWKNMSHVNAYQRLPAENELNNKVN